MLDSPGEWFHDAKRNTLYFYPGAGTDLAAAAVEVPASTPVDALRVSPAGNAPARTL